MTEFLFLGAVSL